MESIRQALVSSCVALSILGGSELLCALNVFFTKGHSIKDPYPPPRRKLTISPPPLRTSCTNLRHSLDNFPPPSAEGGNFLCGWGMDLFWSDPKCLMADYFTLQITILFINEECYSLNVNKTICKCSLYKSLLYKWQCPYKACYHINLLHLSDTDKIYHISLMPAPHKFYWHSISNHIGTTLPHKIQLTSPAHKIFG